MRHLALCLLVLGLSAGIARASHPEKIGKPQYFGGPILSQVKIVAVYWGSNVDPSLRGRLPDFYASILNSSYLSWLSEYSTPDHRLGAGSLKGLFEISPINKSATVTDQEVQKELWAQITLGALPEPDASTFYMVDFPKGMTITLADGSAVYTSCKNFCSYHSSGVDVLGRNLYYAVLPDLGDGACTFGCGSNPTVFDNQTAVRSHVLLGAITDPKVGGVTKYDFPLGWIDPNPANGEIGDICLGEDVEVNFGSSKYFVQKAWSNARQACVTE